MGHEEFFIEPLNQKTTAGGEEKEEEEGRQHIVYRASAIIKEPPAVNRSVDDFHRGEDNRSRVQKLIKKGFNDLGWCYGNVALQLK